MKITDLVEDNWAVNDTGTVNLVQLLDSVLLVKVEAEDSVKLLAVLPQAPNQQDLRRRDLHGNETAHGLRDYQLHRSEFLRGEVKLFNASQSSALSIVAPKDVDSIFLVDAAAALGA